MCSITSLHAEDLCFDTLQEHLKIIKSSDEFLNSFEGKTAEIRSFEITKIQKNLTKRFLSLRALKDIYENSKNHCNPKILSEVVAIYDFGLAEKNIFSDKNMRRIVTSLTKYQRYELTDYLDFHEKYTSNKFILKIEKQIEENNYNLPEDIQLQLTAASIKTPVHEISDSTLEGTKSIIGGLARAWGFLSDSLKWREGHLKNNQKAQQLLLQNLRPLDLIYEKRSFLLSDYTIPGHWGHVGIWLGTKEELIELGVWDEEYFKPFKSLVEEGMNILEIRKEGLNFQSLATFINLDEIAINRVEGAILRAPEILQELNLQIDKKYDFKFDAKSSDKITCSELIAFSYGEVDWKGTKTLNQVSLRPDDLALLSLEAGTGVDFIIYLKGVKKSEEFLNLGFDKWKEKFKIKKQLTPAEKEKIEKERESKRQMDLLYTGG